MSDKILSQSPDAIRKREARARARAGVMTLAVSDDVASAVAAPVEPVAPAVVAAAVAEIEQGETFTFVGWAVDAKGRGAVRFTNDKRRSRTLIRCGCTDVTFIELPRAMTKDEIAELGFVAQVTPSAAQTKSA